MFQRRGNIIGTAVLAMGILSCALGDHAAVADVIKSTPDVVIFSGTYPGWPTIDAAPGGLLVCAWREGTRHEYSSNGKLMFSTSNDDGKTWSAASVIIDAPNIDDRGAAILTISESHWLVAYDAYDGSTHTVKTTCTTDGGATWSTPATVCDSYSITGTRGAPIKLSNGDVILPFHRGPADSHQSLAAISSDNGRTWTTYAVPNADGFKGNEWSVVELADGSLAGVIRTDVNGADGSLWITKSGDKGKTWSTPQKTNLQDTSGWAWKSPGQIFLHEGKPWVLYDDCRFVSVALATTDDPDLLDWYVDDRIAAYQYKADGTRIEDGGYPWAVPLGDGRLLIVDYYIDGGTKQIVGYYATLPLPEPGTLAMIFVAGVGAYVWRRKCAAFTGFASE